MALDWVIVQIDHTVNQDGTANKATSVHWRVSKSVEALSASSYGSTGVTPESALGQKAYADITATDCIAYVSETEDVAAIEAGIDSRIASMGEPKTGAGLPWQDNYPQWMIGTDYAVDDVVTYLSNGYECIQAHTSQATWPPDLTPALWVPYVPETEGPQPWVQPQGAEDAYNTGDKVTHNGNTWVSTADANVWEPGVYGWNQV